MCPPIIHGYRPGDGIVTRSGGDHGDLTHGIGMLVFTTIISMYILGITTEPMFTAIPTGMAGIMETMAGDPDR